MSEIELDEYYSEVESELIGLGYTKHFVQCFRFDIINCWEEGESIQECVDYIA